MTSSVNLTPFRELAAPLMGSDYEKRAIQSGKPAAGVVGSPPDISMKANRTGEPRTWPDRQADGYQEVLSCVS